MSLKSAAMLVVGGAMFFFPEPITSVIGATLVLAAFGLEDESPVGGGA
jgi:hypothetical protein